MMVELDPKVLEFLKKKNRHCLTLNVLQSGGGCCPTIDSVELNYNEPKELEKYHHLELDGIQIYVGKEVKILAAKLHFVLEKSLFGLSIVPVGIQVRGE